MPTTSAGPSSAARSTSSTLLRGVVDQVRPFVARPAAPASTSTSPTTSAPSRSTPTRSTPSLVNLLTNAIKFTPDGRADRAVGAGSSRPDEAEIVVEDRGIGLEPQAARATCSSRSSPSSIPSRHSSGDFGFNKRGLGPGPEHRQAVRRAARRPDRRRERRGRGDPDHHPPAPPRRPAERRAADGPSTADHGSCQEASA